MPMFTDISGNNTLHNYEQSATSLLNKYTYKSVLIPDGISNRSGFINLT